MTEKPDSRAMVSPTDAEAVKIARHVTWVGFWVNAVLGAAKIAGGVLGRSAALIADGVHSLSDFVSDIIVLTMVTVSRKRPDVQHQFGHGKFEALATLILAVVLLAVAVGIFWDGLDRVIAVYHGEELAKPGYVALGILLASIVAKEWLYRYTRRAGERIHSDAVIANAWHHRSDSMSSIATLLGVSGAMFLGPQWRVLDPIAAMVVAVFILWVSWSLGRPALAELLDAALPPSDIEAISKVIDSMPGVGAWHHLRTFKSGNNAYVEVHIKVDPELTVRHAHSIATELEHRIEAALPDRNTTVTTHIEPVEN
ncbi:MAG: cation diffusion facilitator family transporter [Muribaculaceae bacterium]|nr:cation diffusion facilitator family transporter [Muribaculaceae bacterium]